MSGEQLEEGVKTDINIAPVEDGDRPSKPESRVKPVEADASKGDDFSTARPPGDWESMVPTMLPSPPYRESWSSQVDFLMTCISMSVGFGNIYRFPFVAFQNGGGAFLIPYLIVLVVVGRPMYFFELLLGQFTNCGCVDVWNLAPAFRGLGYSMVIASGLTSTFYSSILATVILYAAYSFLQPLPWNECNEEDFQLDGKTRTDVHCEGIHKNQEIILHHMIPSGLKDRFCSVNESCFQNDINIKADIVSGNGSDAEIFFRFSVLKSYESIDNGIGAPDLKLSMCLLAAWIIIFIITIRGVTGAGKIAWFTAMFPYVILFTLFGVSVSLPHASDGIYYFFKPQWSKLLEVQVWFQAVQQCFFSLGMGFGPVIVFGSYNHFRHNISRDVWIVTFMDSFTSLLAGSTIFAILGNLADGRDITTVVESGPNIAFVSYPAVMKDFGTYPLPQIISFLFFFMLLTLGLGSGTSFVNCVITLITEKFPSLNSQAVTTVVCLVGFFSGLIYVTPGGGHMLLLMDTFGSSLILYVVVLMEVIVVSWIYGLRNFCNDVEFMLQTRLNWYWKLCWGIVIPGGLLFVMIYAFITFRTPRVGDYPLPTKAVAVGALVSTLALVIIPGEAVYIIFTRKTRSCYKKVRAAFSPSRFWGPKELDLREEWEQYKRTVPYRYHPWLIFTKDYWKNDVFKCGKPKKSLPEGREQEKRSDPPPPKETNLESEKDPDQQPVDLAEPK